MRVYRDGVGAMRCQSCGSALRDAGDQPLVLVGGDDLDVAVILMTTLLELHMAGPVLRLVRDRLAQDIGQSVPQIVERVGPVRLLELKP